jgi:hypothetical protein
MNIILKNYVFLSIIFLYLLFYINMMCNKLFMTFHKDKHYACGLSQINYLYIFKFNFELKFKMIENNLS